jgi:hypothetical protein
MRKGPFREGNLAAWILWTLAAVAVVAGLEWLGWV